MITKKIYTEQMLLAMEYQNLQTLKYMEKGRALGLKVVCLHDEICIGGDFTDESIESLQLTAEDLDKHVQDIRDLWQTMIIENEGKEDLTEKTNKIVRRIEFFEKKAGEFR